MYTNWCFVQQTTNNKNKKKMRTGVAKKVFRPEREEVIGGWRRFHNGELYDLYSSSHINWVIKSRMR